MKKSKNEVSIYTISNIMFAVTMCILFVFFLVRIFTGVSLTDEPFNVTESYRLIGGNYFLYDIWDNYQTGDLFLAPFLWLYRCLTGSYNGVILFSRMLYLVINIIIAIISFNILKKCMGKLPAMGTAIMMATYAPFSLYYMWYDSCGLLFFYVGILCLIEMKCQMKNALIYGYFAGIFHAFMTLAYPTFIVIVFFEGVILFTEVFRKKTTIKGILAYAFGGITVIGFFCAYCFKLGINNIYLFRDDIGLGTQLLLDIPQITWKIVSGLGQSCLMLKPLVPLYIIFAVLIVCGKKSGKRIIYAVGYIGLLLLPIFYVDSFLKLQNRAVIAYYFYFIGLIPIAILCDKDTFMKNKSMLFEVVGASFIMMCMVAYTAYWGGTKSAIGSVVASGIGFGLFLAAVQNYEIDFRIKHVLQLLSIICVVSTSIFLYSNQFFISNATMKNFDTKVENGIFAGLFTTSDFEYDLQIEQELRENIIPEDETIAVFGIDIIYLYMSSELKVNVPCIIDSSTKDANGEVSWKPLEMYWKEYGYPDIIVQRASESYCSEGYIRDVVYQYYELAYASPNINIYRLEGND